MTFREDLTGRIFGHLEVLSDSGEKYRRSTLWRCRCHRCGGEALVTASNLKSGNTTTCGCSKWADLSGRRFGRLVAKRPAGREHRGVVWECECDCGNAVNVRAASLVSGRTESCGCLKREKAAVRITGSGASETAKLATCFDGTRLSTLGTKPRKGSASGVRGVYLNKKSGRWWAELTAQGERHYLGTYATLGEAAEARREAEQEYFDPILEAYGHKPTSEEDYQEALRKAMESQEKK